MWLSQNKELNDEKFAVRGFPDWFFIDYINGRLSILVYKMFIID